MPRYWRAPRTATPLNFLESIVSELDPGLKIIWGEYDEETSQGKRRKEENKKAVSLCSSKETIHVMSCLFASKLRIGLSRFNKGGANWWGLAHANVRQWDMGALYWTIGRLIVAGLSVPPVEPQVLLTRSRMLSGEVQFPNSQLRGLPLMSTNKWGEPRRSSATWCRKS